MIFEFYFPSLCYAVVCTDSDPQEAERRINRLHPPGTDERPMAWRLSEDHEPRACSEHEGRNHYPMEVYSL